MGLVTISILSSLLAVTFFVCTFLAVRVCRSKSSHKEKVRETENPYPISNASQNCDQPQLSPENSDQPQQSSQQADRSHDSYVNADGNKDSSKKSGEGVA